MIKVIKRNGSLVDFDNQKIENAIKKAFEAVGKPDRSKELAPLVTAKINKDIIYIEEIQDIVEVVLMEAGEYVAAKAYIVYREKQAEKRKMTSSVKETMGIFDSYIRNEDWKVKENSNMNYSLQGLNNHIVSRFTETYWLNKIYPGNIADAHESGDLHIHDLGLLAPYCCGWNLEDLLLNGFGGVDYKVESAAPKHFGTALGQLVNFLYTMQGEAAGAQAVSNFDTLLAPFVFYDNLGYEEVLQEIQSFVYNLNVPTRVGFQTPFSNITLDIKCPSILANQPVVIGGQHLDKTYKDFQKEMDLINMAFCEVMMEGDKKGRMFSFPIPTYNVTKDFPWGSPLVHNIMKMTAKYGTPYFTNFINSDLSPDDVRSMCCRLRIDNRELKKRGGGLFGANPLTGSMGNVTINLPRIGYLAKTEAEYFYRLTKVMDMAKNSLLIKRKAVESFTENGLYPYSKFYLRDVKARFGQYWANHFNTIGIIGMNESLVNFLGQDITTAAGHAFALKIMDFMRDKLTEYQTETNQMFNLEATPGEGTTLTLALKDKKRYPDIFVQGTADAPYYTNSTQLPVDHTKNLIEAIKLQDDLQTKYTGGTVLHGFLGESPTPEAAEDLIKSIFNNFRLPYFSITPTFSICPQDGYIAGEHFVCPKCGKEAEVWSRVVGFYRPVQNWNKGKKQEFLQRVEFEYKPVANS